MIQICPKSRKNNSPWQPPVNKFVVHNTTNILHDFIHFQKFLNRKYDIFN